MQVYEALADEFAAEGVRTVFNLMGDGNKLWLVAMSNRPGVQLVNVRHEAAALSMAEGFARVSGDVGVCSVTYSTGITQIATPLAVAAKHGTPLVVFAADIPADQRGPGSQIDIDVRSIVRDCGAEVQEIRGVDTLRQDVRTAFHRARTGRRPVVVLAAPELQEREVTGRHDVRDEWSPGSARVAGRPRPDPALLKAAADLIGRATRPVVLVGRGAVEAGAVPAVRALAERAGALLATTLPAKGCVDDDPYNLGIAGSYSDSRARSLLARADCLIAVGASLNPYTRAHGELFGGVPTVRVDVRADAAPTGTREVFLHADAAVAADELASLLPAIRSDTWRDAANAEALRQDGRPAEIASVPAPVMRDRTDPRQLVTALDAVLPDDCEVVIGVGNFTTFPVRFLRNPGRRRFHPLLDFITIGQALPVAIGAALAAGARPTVAFEGDASFMMHVQELETAARYAVPMLVFVMNDGALGAEYHKLRGHGLDPAESIMPSADVCEVATAFGARARRLTSLAQVGEIVEWFDADAGPHVVDCPVVRDVVGEL
ncbi:MAG TPA: thiamine pyrophosphate-binding protein [Micromonosporaceae bacterium]